MTRGFLAVVVGLSTLLLSGCVKSSTHNRVLDQLAEARERGVRLTRDLDLARRDGAANATRLEAELSRVQEERAGLEERLEAAQRDVARLRGELRTSENENSRISTLLSQRGEQAALLQSRLQALSAIEQEIRERNRIYEEVIGRFQSLIDGGQLSVSISRGRMVINLPQDILFQSGSATVAADGRSTLGQVAAVLAEIEGRSFQIEGHTDDVPIATARFPSNWELSAARALAVVHLLQEQGVPPDRVSGAAYGEHQPVADNEDQDGRRLNRRIEIVMLPNLNVIAETQAAGR